MVSAPMAVVVQNVTRAATKLCAAQKDTALKLSAKLARLKSFVWFPQTAAHLLEK